MSLIYLYALINGLHLDGGGEGGTLHKAHVGWDFDIHNDPQHMGPIQAVCLFMFEVQRNVLENIEESYLLILLC